MATNAFDALMAEVNQAIAETSTATSEAKAASAKAEAKAQEAANAAQAATTAAQTANTAAQEADEEANAWNATEITTETVDPEDEASVFVTEEDGKKQMLFTIPRGKTGPAGPTGEPGKSGVTFTLSGTKLYITTD